jgi:hypothetical protein
LFNANSRIFQLYLGEEKFYFNKMMVRPPVSGWIQLMSTNMLVVSVITLREVDHGFRLVE